MTEHNSERTQAQPMVLSLADYVKKRNGVALGAKHSLRNMLKRAFGASHFAEFWQYWNPIWGFYLAKYVQRPLRKRMPATLAVLLTFVCSGAIHDAVFSLLAWQLTFWFTPWFTLMGAVALFSHRWALSSAHPWWQRAALNGLLLCSSYWLASGSFVGH